MFLALLAPAIPVVVLFRRQWDDRECDFYMNAVDSFGMLLLGVPLLAGVNVALFHAVYALARRRGARQAGPTVCGLVAVGVVTLAAVLFVAFLQSPLPERYPPELRLDLRPGCSLSELE